MTVTTNSEKETMEVGKKFARRLKGGEVVLLIGDLGSGKTTFVRGVARGFGYKKNVTSPTFVIMKVYELPFYELRIGYPALRSAELRRAGESTNLKKKKIKKIAHVDTYRGLDFSDLEDIGAMEYLGQEDCVSFVEWGAGLEKFLKKKKFKYFVVRIRLIDENTREIEIKNLVS